MNKKKLLALGMVAALSTTAVVGGTLAYFTDTDAQENVFVTGNVAIDLYEDFGTNSGLEKLLPATGSAQNGTLKNGIEKEVYVENTGSEKAYARVHIAIPQILDNGDPNFDAAQNVLHFNYDKESVGANKWNWSKTHNGTTGSDWNFYTAQVGDIWYNVYVVTYEDILEKGEVTPAAMSQVYLDSKVTNADITKIKETLGNQWKIYVVAEAGQADGFEDAYTALNTQFGTPGQYAVAFDAESENKLYVEGESEQMKNYGIANTVSAEGALASASVKVEDNTITYTLDGISLSKSKNPQGTEAYWAGYLNFIAPDYADVAKATFTRDGVVKSFDACKDTANTMEAWNAASLTDKDVHQTYTFDWDGDGVFEAVYKLNVTNITLED